MVPGVEGPVRVLVVPVNADGRDRVVVVGSSLGDRDEALDGLATLLLIGGPAALLLASLAGYGAAAAALRPVEAMRQRAAEISSDGGARLPVPETNDELSRLGETLNAMLGRLETALEHERRFVDDASHELRTPLALHKIELELALSHARDENELREAISSATEEIDRLIELAEQLLVVARSEDGRVAGEPEGSRSTMRWPRSPQGSACEANELEDHSPTRSGPADWVIEADPAAHRAGADEHGRERATPWRRRGADVCATRR